MKKLTITLLTLSFFAINLTIAQTTEKKQTEKKVCKKATELKVYPAKLHSTLPGTQKEFHRVQDKSKLMKLEKCIPIERKIGEKKTNLIDSEKFNKEAEKFRQKKAVETEEK